MSQVQAARFASPAAVRKVGPGSKPVHDGFAAVFDGVQQSARAPGEKTRALRADDTNTRAESTGAARPGRVRPDAKARAGPGSSPEPDRADRLRQVQDRARDPEPAAEKREAVAAASNDAEIATVGTDAAASEARIECDANTPVDDEVSQQESSEDECAQPSVRGQGESQPAAGVYLGPVVSINPADHGVSAVRRGAGGAPLSGDAVSVPAQAPSPADSISNGTPAGVTAVVGRASGENSAHVAPDGSSPEMAHQSAARGQDTSHSGKPGAPAGDFPALLVQVGRGRQPVWPRALTQTSRPGESDATVAMNGPRGAEELARVVRSRVGARHSNLTLQLDPPELGRVRVDVRMHEQAMTLRFATESQAGRDAIQGRLRELTGALEQQGVRVERVEVEYRPPPPDQTPHDRPGAHTDGRFGPESGFHGGREPPPSRADTPTWETPPVADWNAGDESPADTGVDLVV
jgi:flagellar hook-length control protein FliK